MSNNTDGKCSRHGKIEERPVSIVFFFFLLKLAQGRLMGAETEKKAPPRDSVSIDEQEISSSDTNVQIMSIEKFIGREDAVVFV